MLCDCLPAHDECECLLQQRLIVGAGEPGVERLEAGVAGAEGFGECKVSGRAICGRETQSRP